MINRYDPDLLLGYIEDELGEEDRARFERQMAEDEQLAALVRGLTGDRALLRSLPLVEAPTGLVDDALHRLERTMLLDGPSEDDAPPIPIQRGRDIAGRSADARWGRVLGISGLAAAVLIGAGVKWLVIQDDPLNRAARDLAEENSAPSPTSQDDPRTDRAEAFVSPESTDLEGVDGQPARGVQPSVAGTPAEPRNMPAPTVATPGTAEPEAGTTTGSPGLLERVTDAILANDRDRPAPAEPALPPVAIAGQSTVAQAPHVDAPVIALADNGALYDNPAPQLFVITDSPEQTQMQIVAWCLNNGVPVVQAEGFDFAYGYVEPEWTNNTTTKPVDGESKLALLIEAEQLGELVSEMNTNSYSIEQQPTRQRAALNTAQAGRQQAQIQARSAVAPPEAAEPLEQAVPNAEETQPAGYAQLRAPTDLGNEDLTRRNYDNVLDFNNRVALEQEAEENLAAKLAAGEESALGAAGSAPAPGLENAPLAQADEGQQAVATQDPAAEVTAEEVEADNDTARREERPAAPRTLREGESPEEEAVRDHAEPNAVASDEVTQVGELETIESAPRGNWLSPQLPLAYNTPIWSNAPRTQIVPIVLRLIEPQEMDRMLREEARTRSDSQAVEAEPDQPVDAAPPANADPEPAAPAEAPVSE